MDLFENLQRVRIEQSSQEMSIAISSHKNSKKAIFMVIFFGLWIYALAIGDPQIDKMTVGLAKEIWSVIFVFVCLIAILGSLVFLSWMFFGKQVLKLSKEGIVLSSECLGLSRRTPLSEDDLHTARIDLTTRIEPRNGENAELQLERITLGDSPRRHNFGSRLKGSEAKQVLDAIKQGRKLINEKIAT